MYVCIYVRNMCLCVCICVCVCVCVCSVQLATLSSEVTIQPANERAGKRVGVA